jgi:hypothetical protein
MIRWLGDLYCIYFIFRSAVMILMFEYLWVVAIVVSYTAPVFSPSACVWLKFFRVIIMRTSDRRC